MDSNSAAGVVKDTLDPKWHVEDYTERREERVNRLCFRAAAVDGLNPYICDRCRVMLDTCVEAYRRHRSLFDRN